MKKKIITTIVAVMMGTSLCVAGCGHYTAEKNATEAVQEDVMDLAEVPTSEAAGSGDYGYEETATNESTTSSGDTVISSRKLIVTYQLDMNTEHYDDVIAAIRTRTANAGGYIQSESEYTGYDELRSNSLVIRIPSEKSDSWLTGISSQATVTSRSQSQEDVTLNYVDLQSHIEALECEKEALQALMKKAESMEDILVIQTQLTDVNYQLDSLNSQLRVMDNEVTYATVNLYLSEVKNEIAVKRTIGQEIADTFRDSTTGIGTFFHKLIVGILGYSVIIIIVIAIILLAVFGTRKIIVKRKAKKHPLLKGDTTDDSNQ